MGKIVETCRNYYIDLFCYCQAIADTLGPNKKEERLHKTQLCVRTPTWYFFLGLSAFITFLMQKFFNINGGKQPLPPILIGMDFPINIWYNQCDK